MSVDSQAVETPVVEVIQTPDENPGVKRTKVAILGFAPSWKEAPFTDMSYDIFMLNEMYKLANEVPTFRMDRWYEIHSKSSPSKATPEHQAFLKQCPVPLFMQDKYPDIPNSIKFPKDAIMEEFERRHYRGARYFTNSISWMFAHAILEGYKTIALYGVDMANDSEYSFQRASAEYFIGLGEGLGIEIIIPQTSDLLKCTQLYAFESDNKNRTWIKTQMGEADKNIEQLSQQKVMMRESLRRLELHQARMEGAKGAYYEILKRTQ